MRPKTREKGSGDIFKETVSVIRRLKFRPRSSFGQNFVVSRELVDDMVEQANLSDEDRVLEIGGGIGTLTKRIADSDALEVFVVEADRVLERFLRLKFYGNKKVNVIGGDFLSLNLDRIYFNKVVSNPPFHISTQIIKKLSMSKIDLAVMTFQKDFASKMIAVPGSKDYSKISVLSQVVFDVKIVGVFSKNCFYPSPEIDVSLVVMRPKRTCLENMAGFWEFLTYAFNNRNRKLVKVVEEFASKKGITGVTTTLKNFEGDKVFQISPGVMVRIFEAVSQLSKP